MEQPKEGVHKTLKKGIHSSEPGISSASNAFVLTKMERLEEMGLSKQLFFKTALYRS